MRVWPSTLFDYGAPRLPELMGQTKPDQSWAFSPYLGGVALGKPSAGHREVLGVTVDTSSLEVHFCPGHALPHAPL